jgi:cysteine desulfurase
LNGEDVKNDRFIFFDNMNTTFPDPGVVKLMNDVLASRLGNPSSHVHSAGIAAGHIIDEARENVSALINARSGSIIFTSGATESNNLAITGFLKANSGYQLAVSAIEHFSIINQFRLLQKEKIPAFLIEVENEGCIDLNSLEEIVQKKQTLVSIGYANPEIGTIQDLNSIAEICSRHGGILHCDCTAAAGLLEIDVAETGIDLLTLSAHNMYGPAGVGAVYAGRRINISPLFAGGNQEDGKRPGTENISGIAGMGEACRMASENIGKWKKHLEALGDRLWQGLADSIPFIHLTGHSEKRLPGHVSFWVEHIEGESLLLHLNMNGVMASSGSACSSNLKGKDESDLAASHVLTAVGVPTDICAGSITFSLGKYNTEDEVDYVISIMPGIVDKLLAMSPSYEDYKKGKESFHG